MKRKIVAVVIACLASLATGCLLSLSSCDEPEPIACSGKEEVTAEFTMGEILPLVLSDRDTIVLSDTVLTNNYIVFEASKEYGSIEWTIGSDPRVFKERKIQLRFENPGRIEVKLKVTDTPDKACFPNDDGLDILTRTLTIVDKEYSPIAGTYVGSLTSSPSEQFEVTVNHVGDGVYKISNLMNGCSPSENQFLEIPAFKTLAFDAKGSVENGCSDERGYLTLSPNGKDVTINFSIASDPFPTRMNLKFQGQKK